MNVNTVEKASQGLSNYLRAGSSVVIGYGSRIKNDLFAEVMAGVFVENWKKNCTEDFPFVISREN